MKYYARKVTRRERINQYGKLGYVLYVESLKTNDPFVVADMNKGKRIKFEETDDKYLVGMLKRSEADTVIAHSAADIDRTREKGVKL